MFVTILFAMMPGAMCFSISPFRPRDMSNITNQEVYLKQFGYMDNTGAQLTGSEFSSALLKYQQTWGLPATGMINIETTTLMQTPRCGCRDIPAAVPNDGLSGKYRIHSHGGWSKTDLTYMIVNASSTLMHGYSEETLRRALTEWSNVSLLSFTETTDKADIDIFFVSRGHADGYAFDGYGGVLAHAFFPVYGGNVHFDNDEYWTVNKSGSGTDLFLVAVHEFGHSIGLEHSDVEGSIMYPFYTYRDDFNLHKDDIAGVQYLYGVQEETESLSTVPPTISTILPTPSTAETTSATTIAATTPIPSTTLSTSSTEELTSSKAQTTTIPHTTTAISSCAFDQLDAITSDKSGDIFVFHGETYTLVDHNGIVEGFPRNISTDFPEISGKKVDAVVYLPELVRDKCVTRKNGIMRCYELIRPEEVFLFSGELYHRYTGGYLESKRRIDTGLISDEFQGVPLGTSLDAAFTHDGTDIYFVSGDSLWKHSRGNHKVDSCSPESLTTDLLSGVQNTQMQINDVLSLPTTSTYYNYFFIGDSYFRTTDGASSFDPLQYPRDISKWWCRHGTKNDLGFFKHHSVYVETNGDRIVVPGHINL